MNTSRAGDSDRRGERPVRAQPPDRQARLPESEAVPFEPERTPLGAPADSGRPRPNRSHDDRPLTLRETLEEIAAWRRRLRVPWGNRWFAAAALVLIGLALWLVLLRVVPWQGGPMGSLEAVLALDAPWAPIPAPDDPRTASSTGLGTAAWVSAPLVIAAFWFTAAYHLDRTSRRTFRVSDIPGVRHSRGYTLIAIGAVFPLILLGLISGAWGVFALLSWAAASQAWASVIGLLALLLAFAGVVRLANLILDRRAARGDAPSG